MNILDLVTIHEYSQSESFAGIGKKTSIESLDIPRNHSIFLSKDRNIQ